MKMILAAILLALTACASVPQQAPISEPIAIQGGFMCESAAEVIAMTKFVLYGTESEAVECYEIAGTPMVRIRPIGIVDVGQHTIALIEIHLADAVMYGLWKAPQPKK